jgi:hypothetical protein
MTVLSLSKKMGPTEIKANLDVLAKAARYYADELDEAFVKHCDPRALQGGAICEEAHEWRRTSRALRGIASQMEG